MFSTFFSGVAGAAVSGVRDTPPADSLELPAALNSTKCGDLLATRSGFISYKYNENEKYNNNERCIWTIRTHKWETKFLLHDSNFHSEKDRLLIYAVDENGEMQVKAKIDSGTGRDFVGILGPLLFVAFTSDESGVGGGFELEFFGFGYNEATGYAYGHGHLDSASGDLVWPEKPIEFYMNTLATFTLSPELPDSRFQLTVETVDLVSNLRSCQNNFLTVHQLFEEGLVLRLRYCEPDLLSSAQISSSAPLLIVYRAAVGPNNVGIDFSWRKESKN
ncbi:unnamed protein product [Orchesella dallaii]|uniref:CUB domain-containing protein n=1 Tax=Orchesella dallaii TaxID=48710 RepID=A0ABP1RN97_9HEXA